MARGCSFCLAQASTCALDKKESFHFRKMNLPDKRNLRRENGANCLFTGHKRTLATKAQLEKQMAEEAELNERIKFNLVN